MEKEVFEKRINECFEEVVKELRYQIDYNIREGIADFCNEQPTYADVKAVLYGIMEQAPNCVGKPALSANLKRFREVKKRVRFNFFHD